MDVFGRFVLAASSAPDPFVTAVARGTGGQSAGNVVLDAVVFVVGVGILGGALFWITKNVIIDEKH